MTTLAKPKGQALPGTRGNTFWNRTEDLHVETNKGAPYYRPSCDYVPTEEEIVFAVEHGIGLPAKIVYEDQKLIVYDGNKRVRILEAANERRVAAGAEPLRIECSPLRSGQRVVILKWSAVLNSHRHGDDPITEALICAQLKDLHTPDEEIRVAFGWDCTRTIDNRIKLLRLCEPVQKAVASGQLGATKAMGWADMSHAEQKAALKLFLEGPKEPRKQIRRPSQKKLARTLDRLPEKATNLRVLVEWALGKASDTAVGKAFPVLAKALAEDA